MCLLPAVLSCQQKLWRGRKVELLETRKKNQNTETGRRMLLRLWRGQARGSLLGDAHQPAGGYPWRCGGFCISSHHSSAHIRACLPKKGLVFLLQKAGRVQWPKPWPGPPQGAHRSSAFVPHSPLPSPPQQILLILLDADILWVEPEFFPASSKIGSLNNKIKIWNKIAVRRSVLYRASPAQRFAYNQTWCLPGKMWLCHVAGKAEINSSDIAKQSPAEAPAQLSPSPWPRRPLCSIPREVLSSQQLHKLTKNHPGLKTLHRETSYKL